MNVILLTVLLTLLGISLVVLFVWLGVMSWKSIKHRKSAKEIHQSMWDNFNSLYDEIQTEKNEIRDDLDERIQEVHDRIDNRIQEIHDRIDILSNNIEELLKNFQNFKKSVDNFESTVDSRFDKYHNLLKN